ncbi:11960_t:CDS:10, partial [Acaulospora colombiana]
NGQDEESMTEEHVKHGFFDKPFVSNEYVSAHDILVEKIKDPECLQNLSEFMTDIMKRKQEIEMNTLQGLVFFIWVAPDERDKWLKQLAGNVPLRELVKNVPKGVEGTNLLELVTLHRVPLARATWFTKIVGINLTHNDIYRNSTEHTKNWTQTFCTFIQLQSKDYDPEKWRYSISLAKWQFDEGLFDQRLLRGMLDNLDQADPLHTAIWLLLVQQFLAEFQRSRTLMRLLIEIILKKLQDIYQQSLASKLEIVVKMLKNMLHTLFLATPDMFVFPTCWNTYKDLLRRVLVEDSPTRFDTIPSKNLKRQRERYYELIRARNEVFDEKKSDIIGKRSAQELQKNRMINRLIARGDMIQERRTSERSKRHLRYLEHFPLYNAELHHLNQRRIILYGVNKNDSRDQSVYDAMVHRIKIKLPYMFPESNNELDEPIVDNPIADSHLALNFDHETLNCIKHATKFCQIDVIRGEIGDITSDGFDLIFKKWVKSNVRADDDCILRSDRSQWFLSFFVTLVVRHLVSMDVVMEHLCERNLSRLLEKINSHKQLDPRDLIECKNMAIILRLMLIQDDGDNPCSEIPLSTMEVQVLQYNCETLSRNKDITFTDTIANIFQKLALIECSIDPNDSLVVYLQQLRVDLSKVYWFKQLCAVDVENVYRRFVKVSKKLTKSKEIEKCMIEIMQTSLSSSLEGDENVRSIASYTTHLETIFSQVNLWNLRKCRIGFWLCMDQVMLVGSNKHRSPRPSPARLPIKDEDGDVLMNWTDQSTNVDLKSAVIEFFWEKLVLKEKMDRSILAYMIQDIREDVINELLGYGLGVLKRCKELVSDIEEVFRALLIPINHDKKLDFCEDLLDQVKKINDEFQKDTSDDSNLNLKRVDAYVSRVMSRVKLLVLGTHVMTERVNAVITSNSQE